MISAFDRACEAATGFYKDNIQGNAKYIADQMNNAYGAPGRNFFVHIQEAKTPFSWLLWVGTENILAARSGVNKLKPAWSYLFLKFPTPASISYTFISPGQTG